MELQEIQALRAPNNKKSRKRDWTIAIIITVLILGAVSYRTIDERKVAQKSFDLQMQLDSLRHEEHKIIIRILLENQKALQTHSKSTRLPLDSIQVEMMNRLFYQNLEEQKQAK